MSTPWLIYIGITVALVGGYLLTVLIDGVIHLFDEEEQP